MMQIPVQISFENMDPNEGLRAEIERHVLRLEQFHPHITGCRVTISAPKTRHHSGQPYQVSLRLTAPPHQDVSVTRQHGDRPDHEYVKVALKDAFAAAERQLEDVVRRMRGDVKKHTGEAHGRVARLVAGEDYGFIETKDGREVYFHRNSVLNEGFDRLHAGSEVRFSEEIGNKGPQATTVRIIGTHHPAEER
jgi:cold shock CspA family protein